MPFIIDVVCPKKPFVRIVTIGPVKYPNVGYRRGCIRIKFPKVVLSNEFGEFSSPIGQGIKPLEECPQEGVLLSWIMEMTI